MDITLPYSLIERLITAIEGLNGLRELGGLDRRIDEVFSRFEIRLQKVEEDVKKKIRVPCCAEGCKGVFSNAGHRNRHIRDWVADKQQGDHLWSEHVKAAEDLGLRDHGSDPSNKPGNDPQQPPPPPQKAPANSPHQPNQLAFRSGRSDFLSMGQDGMGASIFQGHPQPTLNQGLPLHMHHVEQHQQLIYPTNPEYALFPPTESNPSAPNDWSPASHLQDPTPSSFTASSQVSDSMDEMDGNWTW